MAAKTPRRVASTQGLCKSTAASAKVLRLIRDEDPQSSKRKNLLYILYLILAAVVFYLVWTFNRFIRLRQRARGAWSDIDVQLKRRWDLIPSLVKTVEGYTKHERETLDEVVSARARAAEGATGGRAPGIEEQGRRELGLQAAVTKVLALVEAYPNLKADRSFLSLHQSLVDVENNLQYARRYYNAVVRDYNTLVQSFPSKLLAASFRFQELQFFQIDAVERAAPEVHLPG